MSEVEVMEEERALQVRPQMAPAELTIDELAAQIEKVQAIQKRLMNEGEDYGIIPGTKKPTLLKPGSEKLCLVFRLAPGYQIKQTNLEDGHREYQVVCTLTHIPSGQFYGQGVGCCSTMEAKYRYRESKRVCPDCGAETIFKSKHAPEWYCWVKKGGCGAKFPENDQSIVGQSVGRAENPDLADAYNTVLKMSKKRALIDAVMTATAASSLFTQDLEEQIQPETSSQPSTAAQSETRVEDYTPNFQDPPAGQKANGRQTKVTTGMDTPATPNQVKRLQALRDDPRVAEMVDAKGISVKAKLVALLADDGPTKAEASTAIDWISAQLAKGVAA